jgi:glycosyltransferase involved in cell wall biosynthesis
MKILVINWQDIKNPFGGGAEVHLHEIFKRIVIMGHEVTLLCCCIDGEPFEEVIDGIRVIRRGNRSLFNFIVKKNYIKLIEQNNFDIIIDDINKIPFYTPLFVKKPLLAISHHFFGTSIFREVDVVSGIYVYLAEFLVNFIYKNIQFAVVSQSTLDEFIERGFSRNKFTIIENAIHQIEYPMKVSNKNDSPVITYFGRLKKYKSVQHLLYSFKELSLEYPKAKLYIMGRGNYETKLKNLAKHLSIDNSTTFFGFVSEKQKIELLSESWVVVNTSIKEGWGITNIEANACGTAVVSANVPGLRDSVNNGKSGLLYEYGKINDLTIKIKQIIHTEKSLNEYSNGALEWASGFSWDQSAQKMITLCEKVIKKF